jgi:hypothetical protein
VIEKNADFFPPKIAENCDPKIGLFSPFFYRESPKICDPKIGSFSPFFYRESTRKVSPLKPETLTRLFTS